MAAARPRQPRLEPRAKRQADRSSRRRSKLGINFFDTANRLLGSATARRSSAGRCADYARRDEVVIATKVHGRMRPGPNGAGLSRKAIFVEIDASLKRLGIDYVDLYQIHRWDHDTPIEETLEALNDVVKRRQGAATSAPRRCIAWQFAKALAHRREARLDALRQTMQNLRQPALPRGRARDAAALRRPRASASSRGARWRAAD